MLVMAKVSGHYATESTRINTFFHQAGDVFEAVNLEYVNECVESGVLALVSITENEGVIEIETIDNKVNPNTDIPNVELPEPVAVPTTISIPEYKEIVEPKSEEVNATPQAIELAKELGIDITHVKSKGSKVTVMDVKNYSRDSLV